MNNPVFRRVFVNHNGQKQLRGFLAAELVENNINVGWSFCAESDVNVFDKQLGKVKALGRSRARYKDREIPNAIQDALPDFYNQVVCHYKDVPGAVLNTI